MAEMIRFRAARARIPCRSRWGRASFGLCPVVDDLAHIEPTTEEPSSVTPQRRSSRHADAHTTPSSSPVGPFRNAVLADVVGIRTHTPRHRTQGAQQQKKTFASRDNAPP